MILEFEAEKGKIPEKDELCKMKRQNYRRESFNVLRTFYRYVNWRKMYEVHKTHGKYEILISVYEDSVEKYAPTNNSTAMKKKMVQ